MNKNLIKISLFVSCFISVKTFAQNVGINTTTPQTNLDVNGMIRIRGGNPGTGKVLTSDSSGFATWQNVPSSADNWGSQTVQTNASINGNGTAGNLLRIAQQGATNGQILKWNGTNWVPSNDSIGADNWGGQTVQTSSALTGNGTSGNVLGIAQQGALSGQVLKWNGTNWVPRNDSIGGDNWGGQTVLTNASLTGNGTLGNALRIAQQGAFIGQVLKWNGITWSPSNDSVGLGTSSPDNWGTQTAVTNARISGNGTIASPLDIAQNGATTGQVLKWNGTNWAPSVDTFNANTVWKINGNSGTNPATHFIGTSDNQNIIFKRNNAKAGMIAQYNTAFGNLSLGNLATGQNNTAFGYYALGYTDSGNANVGLGSYALTANRTGSGNVGIGIYSLFSNLGGSENVGIGQNALFNNESGISNVAIGSQAQLNLTSGYGNVAIGTFAGSYNKTGSYNTFLGGDARPLDSNLVNATAIGYDSRVGQSNSLILGDSVNTKVGIGTAYPTKKLDLRGQLRIVDGTQGNNKVLTSDAQGNASWQNAALDNWGTQKVETDSTLNGAGTLANPLKIAKQGAANGQVLKYNGTTWLPANDSVGADNWGSQKVETDSTLNGTGTLANPLKIAKQGAANGQVLKYNGTTWLPANDSVGADNWGTQKVETDSTINGTGTLANPLKLAKQGATDGQVLKYNGTTWLPSNEDTTNNTTLNEAYNQGSPGGGREIIAKSGAVNISGFDGLLVTGTLDSGMNLTPLAIGPRMLFYPKKAAFRAGIFPAGTWQNDSIGLASFATGSGTTAKGIYSFAAGFGIQATGQRSFASGYFSNALGTSSTAMGSLTTANGLGAFAAGSETKALNNFAIAMGDSSIANNTKSVAIGSKNISNAVEAITLGSANAANDPNAIAIGYSNIADSNYATAMGHNTWSKGWNSITFGENTIAQGRNTFAAGEGSTASNQNSVAMGFNSTASNYASFALGDNAVASGAASMAAGYFNIASGESSFAFGNNNIASGITSFAGGNSSFATGSGAIAIGDNNLAKGVLSSAFGNNLIATGANAVVIGRFNDSIVSTQNIPTSATPLFTVGNGTSNTVRKNAMVVLNSGNVGVNINAPTSTFQNNGTISLPGRVSNTSTSLTDSDHTIILSSTATVITFPAANLCPGRIYYVVSQQPNTTATNYVTLSGTLTNTLNAATSYTFQSINNQWYRIQ